MRTFILRILVDEGEPEPLRGILRLVASGEERPFDSQQGLLDLIRLLCAVNDQAPAKPRQEKASGKA
jgi:hypothetical protein